MPGFTDRIRPARKRLGLSQKAAAKAVGLPLRTFQAYERGENDPPADRAAAIADALGMDAPTELPGGGPARLGYLEGPAAVSADVLIRIDFGGGTLVDVPVSALGLGQRRGPVIEAAGTVRPA